MRILMAAALATMTTPALADMAIVCQEPWGTGLQQRFEVSLPDGGVPIVKDYFVGEGSPPPLFGDDPRVLGHTLTRAEGKVDGTPFSSIMIESRVTDEGVERFYPARMIYVDWGRTKVWAAFMSMLDAPGGNEVKGCKRTD